MKKLFAVVLILALALCGCKNVSQKENLGDVSKWNTKLFDAAHDGGLFFYEEQNDTLFYRKSDGNGKFSLAAKKGDDVKILCNEPAYCIYALEDKVYYSNGEQILSINADGTGRKVLADAKAKGIAVLGKDVLYLSEKDWKIHKIAPDGTDTRISTFYRVANFMIYNGKIYFCGFVSVDMSTGYTLCYYDAETQSDDALIMESVTWFDIEDDVVYACVKDEGERVRKYDINGKLLEESVSPESTYSFCLVDKEPVYVKSPDGENTYVFSYDNDKCVTELQYVTEERDWKLCGPYLCAYDDGEHIERWQGQKAKPAMYKGKENYTDVSLGDTGLAWDDEYYYYIDFVEAFKINKQTKERTSFINGVDYIMWRYKDTLIFEEYDCYTLYNLQTKQKSKVSCKEGMFNHYNFSPEIYMVENGFVMHGHSPELGKTLAYFVDSKMQSKKFVPVDYCEFVIDNEIFYLSDKDANVYSYDMNKQELFKVTDYEPTFYDYENSDRLASNILEYLGRGKILAYGDDKLQIINLADLSSVRPYTKEQEDKMQDITAIYDDNAIYFLIWESATEYRVDKLDYKTLKPETIYKAGEPSPDTELTKYQIKFAACDDQYIYFRDFAPMDEGNHFRIKKDGSGKEVLFNHMGEELYSIENYE